MSIHEDFAQLEAEFGADAVREFTTAAYPEIFGELAKAAPDAIAQLSAKVDQLVALISKLVDAETSEDDTGPTSLTKATNGRLSDADRQAVRGLMTGF